jgi:hypothetical protein
VTHQHTATARMLPRTTRGAVLQRYGPPDDMAHVAHVAFPQAGVGEVLVAVDALLMLVDGSVRGTDPLAAPPRTAPSTTSVWDFLRRRRGGTPRRLLADSPRQRPA